MSVHSSFFEAASTRLSVSENDSAVDLYSEQFGERESNEMLEFSHLELPYQLLAMKSIQNIQRTLDNNHAAKYGNGLGATTAGIALMTKYLSFMPYVYLGQRGDFPAMPTDRDEQINELGQIARNSNDVIATIASQHMPIAGRLERTQKLRERERPIHVWYDDLNYDYRLQKRSNGLGVTTRFRLEGQIEAAEYRYAHSNTKSLPVRAVGCMALRLKDVETGESAFDAFWGQLVDAAATDPSLFADDLQRIAKYQEEYGVTGYSNTARMMT